MRSNHYATSTVIPESTSFETPFTLETNGTVPNGISPKLVRMGLAIILDCWVGTVPFGDAIRALFAPLMERFHLATFRLIPE